MAVTITKRFMNNETSPSWKTLSKIVFTSPNMDSEPADPRAAGSRSHILPGSRYIGTWYEASDYMYRIRDNQNYPVLSGIGTHQKECYFSEIFLNQDTFTFGTDTTLSGRAVYNPTVVTGTVLFYDRDNYGIIDTIVTGTQTSIEGITFNRYTYNLSTTYGSAVISGTTSGISADNVYGWGATVVNDDCWMHAGNSMVFKVTNGEAYNCRLTAWDDATHSSTNNPVISGSHYRVMACAYRAGGNQSDTAHADTTVFRDYESLEPSSKDRIDSMIFPPGIRIPLKGNVYYYGDFDLIHRPEEYAQHGEYLIFTGYLYDIDSFSSGNYDFVTTLHYSYT